MPDSPELYSPLSFDIDYVRFSEGMKNADFKGRGRLEIAADGSRFRFHGTLRGWGQARQETLELPAEEIANVMRSGERISFHTSRGQAGQSGRPFVFYCHGETAARQVVALLPDTTSAGFREDSARLVQMEKTCPPFPHQSSPTSIIIALNALVFLVMALFFNAGWIQPNSLDPYIRFGANNGAYTTSGEWWRLFTSLFLHYGILHVALNCWVLSGAGHLLERLVGRPLFLAVYFGSGLVASLSSIFWHGDSTWSAGASGAVFSVYGAVLAISLRGKRSLPSSLFTPLRNSTLAFIGYNFLFSAAHPGIDNAAHLGGLLAGFVLGYLSYVPIETVDRPARLRRAFPIVLATAAALVAAGVAFAPRFDYDPREQEAFRELFTDFSQAESGLLERIGPTMDVGENGPEQRQAAIRAIESEAIPFYREWSESIARERLPESGRAERNRQRLEDYAAIRVDAFRALATYLETPNPETEAAYTAAFERSNAHLESLETIGAP